MSSRVLSLTFQVLVFSSCTLAAVVPRAIQTPTVASISLLGTVSSTDTPTVNRDGGGGGLLNGHSIWTFCDSQTSNGAGLMNSFAANSIAYASTSDPLALQDYGVGSEGQIQLAIPFTANETEYNDAHDPSKQRYAIWPGSSLLPALDGSGYLFPGVTRVDATSGTVEYIGEGNTDVNIKATDDGPVVERVVDRLFYGNEIAFGSFSSIAHTDGQVYLFGASSTGLFIARTDTVLDRSTYSYYTPSSSSWTSTLPSSDSTDVVVATLFSSGDIFWSTYHNTYLMVYMNGYADSKFYLRYSTDGGLTSWSEESLLWESTVGKIYNYAGHARPEFDTTGKTLVLTFTYANEENVYETHVGKVEFA